MIRQFVQQAHRIRSHDLFCMPCVKMAGDLSSMRQFTERPFLEPHGESLERSIGLACGGGDYHTGIKPATEKGADGHIGDQMEPHGLRHFCANRLLPLFRRRLVIRLDAQLPVAARRSLQCIGFNDEVMCRRQLLHSLKY